MKPVSDINTPDMSAFWMPFTANQQFKAAPRILKSAEGMYYHSEDGRKILDGTAGLWCCNAGHGRREIAEDDAHYCESESSYSLPTPTSTE